MLVSTHLYCYKLLQSLLVSYKILCHTMPVSQTNGVINHVYWICLEDVPNGSPEAFLPMPEKGDSSRSANCHHYHDGCIL